MQSRCLVLVNCVPKLNFRTVLQLYIYLEFELDQRVFKLHYHSNQVVKKYFLGSGELIGAHHMSVHAVVRAKNAHPHIAMVAKKSISSLIFAATQRACSRARAHMVHARVGHREIRIFTWPVRRRRKEMFWDYLIGNLTRPDKTRPFLLRM